MKEFLIKKIDEFMATNFDTNRLVDARTGFIAGYFGGCFESGRITLGEYTELMNHYEILTNEEAELVRYLLAKKENTNGR